MPHTLFLRTSLRLCLAIGLSAAAVAATAAGDERVARIDIYDRPAAGKVAPYRYVRWEGEHYSPGSFETAIRGKADALFLTEPTDDAVRCVAALSRVLSLPASSPSGAIAPSDAAVGEVCAIAYDVPRPTLEAGQYFVARTRAGFAVDGEAPLPVDDFVDRLKRLAPSAIVMYRPTIGDMMCWSRVAAAAHVDLLDVEIDGSLSRVRVKGGSLAKACGG